jgi:hypothetical protein
MVTISRSVRAHGPPLYIETDRDSLSRGNDWSEGPPC